MTDIFQEVEEDVRRERLMALWRRYGPYVIGAVVGALALTAGLQAWRAYERSAVEAAATQYLAADTLAQTDAKAAAEQFAALGAGRSGYALLARFREADLRTRLGDRQAALALYDAIAAEAGRDDLLGSLATLKGAFLALDTTSRDDLEARLAPLITATGPWRHSAREILAFAALKAGDRETARTRFAALVDDSAAPPGVRGRAQDMLEALGGRPAAPPPPASE